MRWSSLATGLQRALFGTQAPIGSRQPLDRGNWWTPVVHEPYTGAWQRNMEQRPENILAFHAVYACIERIASDVAKCRLRLVEEDANGIWTEIFVPAFTPVIRKPNHYQNRIQFFESWMLSKLMSGNTYVLKERDARNVVVRLYVLDPRYVKPLVAPDGTVLYELSKDNLAGLEKENVVVPGSEDHPRHDDDEVAPSLRLATNGTGLACGCARAQHSEYVDIVFQQCGKAEHGTDRTG